MEYSQEYNPKIAILPNHYAWLRAKATPIDLTSKEDVSVASDISSLLQDYDSNHDNIVAMSSNNLFLEGQDVPRRIIYVERPDQTEKIVIVNPEIETSGVEHLSFEACAALPGSGYIVQRHSYVKLNGYVIEDDSIKPIEMEYGVRDPLKIFDGLSEEITRELFPDKESKIEVIALAIEQKAIKEGRLTPASAVQHEMNHLDGILISDHGERLSKEK